MLTAGRGRLAVNGRSTEDPVAGQAATGSSVSFYFLMVFLGR